LRLSFSSKSLSAAALLAFLFVNALVAPILAAPIPSPDESARMLPDRLGDYRARGAVRAAELELAGPLTPEDFNAYSSAARLYASPKGETFTLTITRTRSDASAYALLKRYIAEMKSKGRELEKADGIGAAAFATPEGVLFFKGGAFVSVKGQTARRVGSGQDEPLMEFARAAAAAIRSEENDIPALVRHLPDWETAQERAAFAVSLRALQAAAGDRPTLEAIDFTGGTEAVTAPYGAARLVIVEFSTPQISVDNDARINARLKELSAAGQPVPTLYRRVGNYSVFVFDAPDAPAAEQLIDRISYEKVVQWLGDNPHAWERVEKDFNETTSNLIVGAVKTSGVTFLLALAVGTLFGSIVFIRRRSQQATNDKYSDAGGMMRLNIDELTPRTDPSRLLGRGSDN
jgi:hypothetical protein